MGAWYDSAYGYGTDMNSAFKQVVSQAQWEDGHGGYTGTMAEKDYAVEIAVPVSPGGVRMKVSKFENLAGEVADFMHDYTAEDLEHAKRAVATAKPGTVRDAKARLRRAEKEHKAAQREKARAWKKVPEWARHEVERLAEVAHGDKWGPAAAVELHGSELSAYKKNHNLKGKRGIRVWKFMGYCSS